MFSFFTVHPSHSLSERMFSLQNTTELCSEAQTQNLGLSFEELEYLSLGSPWSTPEDNPVLIPEKKHLVLAQKKISFLAMYWDEQPFHRHKRGSSLDC